MKISELMDEISKAALPSDIVTYKGHSLTKREWQKFIFGNPLKD